MILNTQVSVNSGSTSLYPKIDSKKSRDGTESENTSDIAAQLEPIRTSRRSENENCIVVTDLENKDATNSTPLGVLDDFLTAQGPSSIRTETVSPTANKATSEMVSL